MADALDYEDVPHSLLRRRVAEHMTRSVATSPHVYTSVEVDYDAVDRARASYGPAWKRREGFSLTYLPFVLRAVALALRDHPLINSTFRDDCLRVHRGLNVGVAVDLDFQGLIVPVIERADRLGIVELARRINDLAARARAKKLTPEDVSGGSFTITSSGSFGTHLTLPILNQPQAAILSVDGVHRRPTVTQSPGGEEIIAVHTVGLLALTWDHRAFDGAYAAAFLRTVRAVLERHEWEGELLTSGADAHG